MRTDAVCGLLILGWTSVAAAQPIAEVDPPTVVEMPARSAEPAQNAMGAVSGGELLVAWRRYDYWSEPILATLVSASGEVVAPARALDVGLPYFTGVTGYGDGWLVVGAATAGPIAVPLDHDLNPGKPITIVGTTMGLLGVGTAAGAGILVGRGEACIEATVLRPGEPPRLVTTDFRCTASSVRVFEDGDDAYVQTGGLLFRVMPDELELVPSAPGTIVAVHDGAVVRSSYMRDGANYTLQLSGLGEVPIATVTTPRAPEGSALFATAAGWTLYYAVPGPDWRDPYSVHYARLSTDGAVLGSGLLGTGFLAPRWFYAGAGATFAVGDGATTHTLASGASVPRRAELSGTVVRSGTWNTGVATAEGAWLIAEPTSDDGEMRPLIIDVAGGVAMQPRIPALAWGRATWVWAASVGSGLALARVEEPGGTAIGSAASATTTPVFASPTESTWPLDVATLVGVPHLLLTELAPINRYVVYELDGARVTHPRPIDLEWPNYPLQLVDCGDEHAVLSRSPLGLAGTALGRDGLKEETWLVGPGEDLTGPGGTALIAVSEPPGQPAVAWIESGHLRFAFLDVQCRPIMTHELALEAIPIRLGVAVAGDVAAVVWTEPDNGPLRLVVADDTGMSSPITLAEGMDDSMIGASVLAMPDGRFLVYWSSRADGDYVTRPRFTFVRASHPSEDAGASADGGAPGGDAALPPLDAGPDAGGLTPGGGGHCSVAHGTSESLGWTIGLGAIVALARRQRRRSRVERD